VLLELLLQQFMVGQPELRLSLQQLVERLAQEQLLTVKVEQQVLTMQQKYVQSQQ